MAFGRAFGAASCLRMSGLPGRVGCVEANQRFPQWEAEEALTPENGKGPEARNETAGRGKSAGENLAASCAS